jgi:putative FmdB family regulatory protein
MPTYEYRCSACGHKWDEFQSIKAAPSRKCPACKKLKAERVISAGGGIIFRGSGFYQTDYRSESWKKGEEAAKKASDSGGSGATGASPPAADSASKSAKSSGSDK